MPQSLSRILIHLVFSTKNRDRVLNPIIQQELHGYLAGILNGIECPALQVGGIEDHVHLLFGLSRTRTMAEIVETVKTSSSKWLKTKGAEFARFHWQNGYGGFSCGQSEVTEVISYIRDQARHHLKMTFQEEYRGLLERYQIPFDERMSGIECRPSPLEMCPVVGWQDQGSEDIPALQAGRFTWARFPGRCPGLRNDAPLALRRTVRLNDSLGFFPDTVRDPDSRIGHEQT